MLIVHGSCLIVDPIDPDNERNYRLLAAACVDTEMYSLENRSIETWTINYIWSVANDE